MKTKVVPHVEREWMRDWKSERVWEWLCAIESVKLREWLLNIDMKTKVVQHVKSDWMREWETERVTFEHRHENKSCSACQEWVNERLKEWESERVWECESVRVWECESERESVKLKSNRWGWWGGWGPKKSIAIFGNKQRLLSIDMKKKLFSMSRGPSQEKTVAKSQTLSDWAETSTVF